MTIDTACASSLVAIHQAVQALRSGASKVAVAASVNLLSPCTLSPNNVDELYLTAREWCLC